MSQYRYTLREAIHGIPVTAIFAILPAHRTRMGDDSQPTYGELAAENARARCQAFLEKHYQIQIV